ARRGGAPRGCRWAIHEPCGRPGSGERAPARGLRARPLVRRVAVEDLSMKVGLLMEAAETQQALAAAALERLREHAAGLDGIVREEIRSTLIEELGALDEDSRRAAQSLRALKQAASLRLAAWSVGVTALSAAMPFGMGWWLLPSHAEVAALRATRAELSTHIAQLTQQGGRVELRHCGAARRLCVHVDRGAPTYGEASDYLVVKGY